VGPPKKRSRDKKRDEKALIPLPPTGLGSLFFATVGGCENQICTKAVAGATRDVAFSSSERFCKEVWLLFTEL
jgi:hypothetical protein